MSLYRFFRTSALLALAGKYRNKLFRIAVAMAVALVTAWLYTDVADYLRQQYPDLLGRVLAAKTVIVYGALVYAFWQLRPGAWGSGESATELPPDPMPPHAELPQSGPLDEFLDKPKLKTRREAILDGARKSPGATPSRPGEPSGTGPSREK
jgi:hypothetical protein